MIEKEYNKQKEILNDKMSDLRDFYSKQKEMLQDSYDEEEYLEEQAEKRKEIAELQAKLTQLEYDDSAWAAKRRLELQEELEEKIKDLQDFERDHALEVAQDELDKLSEIQSKELENQIEAIDDILDNQQILYEQALSDMQNNNLDLYQEFLEYNRKYGTGEDSEIVDMWNEAYKSLKDYYDIFGEYYKGINLINAAGYEGTDVLPTESDEDRIVVVPAVVSGEGWTSSLSKDKGTTGSNGGSTGGSTGGSGSGSGSGSGGGSGNGTFVLSDYINDINKSGVTNTISGVIKSIIDPINNISHLIRDNSVTNSITIGDTVINGNTNNNTLSEINRANEKLANDLLSIFNKK